MKNEANKQHCLLESDPGQLMRGIKNDNPEFSAMRSILLDLRDHPHSQGTFSCAMILCSSLETCGTCVRQQK